MLLLQEHRHPPASRIAYRSNRVKKSAEVLARAYLELSRFWAFSFHEAFEPFFAFPALAPTLPIRFFLWNFAGFEAVFAEEFTKATPCWNPRTIFPKPSSIRQTTKQTELV